MVERQMLPKQTKRTETFSGIVRDGRVRVSGRGCGSVVTMIVWFRAVGLTFGFQAPSLRQRGASVLRQRLPALDLHLSYTT